MNRIGASVQLLSCRDREDVHDVSAASLEHRLEKTDIRVAEAKLVWVPVSV